MTIYIPLLLQYAILLFCVTSAVAKPQSIEISTYQQAASQGDVVAQVALARLYLSGYGVKRRVDYAQYWLDVAASHDYPEANHELGLLYSDGKFLPRDFIKAYKYFLKAALVNHSDAQLQIAHFYEHGYGVKKSGIQSIQWYIKAAKLGHPRAQYKLGLAYVNGEGVEKDPALAMAWLEKAAEQGSKLSHRYLSKLSQKVTHAELIIARSTVEELMQG